MPVEVIWIVDLLIKNKDYLNLNPHYRGAGVHLSYQQITLITSLFNQNLLTIDTW